ncbi:MAG: nucleotidyltransferase family protein [Ruminococcaceae bacterium]|nr:nucleotidyltransferase family protein [Oscillospiraceae bacterium]
MVAGIVCEYNPFHKGHLYQLEKTKQAGADAVVCVMSGNYVQRGECAFVDKWTRARSAVLCGADVVIDLPVPWAVSSAENFARGSVYLLKQFGIDVLSFGSECDGKKNLLLAAESVKDERVAALIKKYMSEGSSYPSALFKGVNEIYGSEAAAVVSSPNSTLAVEYINQLNECEGIDFMPVKRKGALHDSDASDGELLSASKIRGDIAGGRLSAAFLPEASYDGICAMLNDGCAPCLISNNERGILSSLRELTPYQLEEYISDEKGLAQRIYDAMRSARSLNELYESVKVKNYTLSRIRREVLCAWLRIPKQTALGLPPYIRILAVSEKGLELLSAAKKNSAIPVVTRHTEMQKLSKQAKEIYEIQCSSTDKFALFSPRVRECGLEQRSPLIVVR